MARVGMVVYGGVAHDARVRRSAATLVAAGHEVVIGSLAGSNAEPSMIDGARVISVPVATKGARLPGADSPFRSNASTGVIGRSVEQARWVLAYGLGLWRWRNRLRRVMPRADVWHGHDLFGLWAADALSRRDSSPLIYDSHELFLESGSAARMPEQARTAIGRLEGRLARRAGAVVTVNPAIADELRQRYGVDPAVILNVPRDWEPRDRHLLRNELGLGDQRIVLFHGALSPGRGIESLIRLAPSLPRDAVTVLLGDGPSFDELVATSSASEFDGRLVVHPAVPLDDLSDWVADATVGVIAFEAINRNNYLATPNKLFEYLLAGVPVVVSDFPEMRRIVREVRGGVLCDPADPTSIREAIMVILSDPSWATTERRADIRTRARVSYSWSTQAERLLAIHRRILP